MATPEVLYGKQFEDNIKLGLQQVISFLRDKGIVKSGVKGKSKSFGYIDQADAREKTTRLSDTIWDDPSANRVTCYLHRFYKGVEQDGDDELKMIADPKATYTQTVMSALRRKVDEKIIAAIRGTKYTGENGTSSSSLPSGRKIAASSAGLTKAKLISALELLSSKGDGTMSASEEAYMVITNKQRSDLLNIAEVTSADYNTVKTLVTGKVVQFLGFTFFIVDPDLVPNSGTTRYCVAWKKSGLGIAFGEDIKVRTTELATKHFDWAVYAEMYFNATRIEDAKVVELACIES